MSVRRAQLYEWGGQNRKERMCGFRIPFTFSQNPYSETFLKIRLGLVVDDGVADGVNDGAYADRVPGIGTPCIRGFERLHRCTCLRKPRIQPLRTCTVIWTSVILPARGSIAFRSYRTDKFPAFFCLCRLRGISPRLANSCFL